MKVPRSPFRRPSAHSAPAAGYKQKKALFIGTKYDTPGSPQGDTFGKHDDVLAVQRLLIGMDRPPSQPSKLLNVHCHSV